MTLFIKLTCCRFFSSNFSMSPKITNDILSRLRDVMKNTNYVSQSLHAYLIPSADAHQNEYVGACDERRSFVSGFTGSAGTAIVSETQAALWTDGRYFLQAEKQMDDNWTLMREGVTGTPNFSQFLDKILPVDGRVGVDPHLISFNSFESLATELELKGHTLLPIEKNLVDVVWVDRPLQPLNKVESIPIEYTGKSWQDKVLQIRKEMDKENASAVVITALDEIAWLFNLRGSDIEFNPVFFAYSIITSNSVFLFIDNPERLTPEARVSLEEGNVVQICPYGTVVDAIQSVLDEKPGVKVWINGSSSYSLVKLIPKKQRVLKETPISLSKALKNEQEIKCAKRAHVKDAVALCEFFCWLSQEAKEGNVTEISAADKLENFRKTQDHYSGPSFETISSSGPNGAIIHYKPTKATDRKVTAEELYLCDSGAQYRDGGTTDVTRTLHFGTPTSFEKMCYTLVLKGHIALSAAIFPQHIAGNRLDSFARQPLWEHGLDYMHGTGHGVGAYLNVHEGPIGIHYHSNKKLTGLQEGMILSIEPGVYLDGKFGIRLENLAILKKTNTPNNFRNTGYLTFEPITLVPFQTKLIDSSLLNEKEVKWLNDYHSTCRDVVGKVLNEQSKTEALKWLLQETLPLG